MNLKDMVMGVVPTVKRATPYLIGAGITLLSATAYGAPKEPTEPVEEKKDKPTLVAKAPAAANGSSFVAKSDLPKDAADPARGAGDKAAAFPRGIELGTPMVEIPGPDPKPKQKPSYHPHFAIEAGPFYETNPDGDLTGIVVGAHGVNILGLGILRGEVELEIPTHGPVFLPAELIADLGQFDFGDNGKYGKLLVGPEVRLQYEHGDVLFQYGANASYEVRIFGGRLTTSIDLLAQTHGNGVMEGPLHPGIKAVYGIELPGMKRLVASFRYRSFNRKPQPPTRGIDDSAEIGLKSHHLQAADSHTSGEGNGHSYPALEGGTLSGGLGFEMFDPELERTLFLRAVVTKRDSHSSGALDGTTYAVLAGFDL